MFACAKLVAPSMFETLPSATANSYIAETIVKLGRAVKQVEPVFATSPAGKLVEIPVEEVGLQHAVKAFVRKIRKE